MTLTVRTLLLLAAAVHLASCGALEPASPQPASQQQQQQQVGLLQAHLSHMQTQTARQLSQLNGLVQQQLVNGSQPVGQSGKNVLEVLSNVGKAIQQQILSSPSVQIMGANTVESANNKKNEYQSVAALEQPAANQTTNYREQGELLRQEIVRRAGQLQQVVAGSMELLKNNSDLIVRRLLEQLNSRLDQAKSKADKIINEPATNEVGLRALSAINQGLNNLNHIITNIVSRLEAANPSGQRAGQPEPARPLRLNLHQLGQQFSSALSAVQKQQQQVQVQG